MFIDKTYFYGPLMIAEWEKEEVQTNLQQFIEAYEPELLDLLLGYKLYKNFKAGLLLPVVPEKWSKLLYGAEYETRFGNTEKWEGFVKYTDGVTISTYFPDDRSYVVDGPALDGDGNATYNPASGQNAINDPFLIGKSYRFVERGTGPLTPVTEWQTTLTGLTKTTNFVSLGGVYTVEFTAAVPLPAPASAVTPGNKVSLIANWVYYWYTRDAATQTTGTGEKVAVNKNAESVTSRTKGMRAYNQMVDKNRSLREFLLSNSADYSDYYLNSGEPLPYFKKDSVNSIFKYINIGNL